MSSYKLLEPIKVGCRILKNRIVMPPMEARLNTPAGDVTQDMIDYYAERAKGGASAIIVESTFIDGKESRSSLISSGLHSDHFIKGKNLLAEAIQDNGALAILQLSHGGRQAKAAATGLQPVAPSALECKVTQRMPRALKVSEIEQIEDDFAAAAMRAKMAGFDGIEIHGAHGYLIFSFFSPYSNIRQDIYGGSIENRARFAVNIAKKIKQKVGNDMIVGLRISGTDFIENGFTIDMACQSVKLLEEYIDYVHVSGGIYETSNLNTIVSLYGPYANLVPLAAKMKKSVNIPVITVGSLDVALGEQALREGKADIVAFGRALIADPYLPKKVAEGRAGDIRPCIRGNEGCISRFYTGCAMRCEVNPACGREREFEIKKAAEQKRVLVAGGGVAGMEAARIADLMGHKVTLLEKSNTLGGHLIEGSAPDFKDKVSELLEWQKRQLKKSGVDIRMQTAADKETVESIKPDALVIAIGSDYMQHDIEGSQYAVFADKALLDPESLGECVVVVGGGLIGTETALMLAQQHGKKVVILEMLEDIARDHEPGSKESLLYYLEEAGVEILCGYKVDRIEKDQVACSSGKEARCIKADSVVIATGLCARNKAVSELKNIIDKTFVIGDCKSARRIFDAFHDAWKAVMRI